ncbi:MAG: 16S rRNA (uracil(1498)-N(3))-methyltransferase [Candidatus Eremiobacteraeota bacterium]|nr:16S rRNA (uracil(1498)-N(3))-methyltransferase [Candidatus Eremiobacteraeota bacterium]
MSTSSKAPRFFVDQTPVSGARVSLDPQDVRHAALVLRLRDGDPVVVVAKGKAWQAQVASIDSRAAIVVIGSEAVLPVTELPQPVIVLQAVPKSNKMDYVVEKVVELGATSIVPVQCERSYGGVSEHKVERWRKIARSAAQQSRRLSIPHVEEPITWEAALQRFAAQAQILVAHEAAAAGSLARALDKRSEALAFAIGPEGSFTQAELESARSLGADFVSLGSTVLRTETAAVAMLAAVASLKRWW